MEAAQSNQNPDSDHSSSSDPDIDQTIQVRRVHEIPDSLYPTDFDPDYMGGESSDFAEQEYEVQSQYDAPSSWQHELGPELPPEQELDPEPEPYPQSEVSEPATVGTRYYSQHETLIFPEGSSGYITETVRPMPLLVPTQRKFRFTPASASAKTETQPRARSAPPVPLTDFEEFKGSKEFIHLEVACIAANELVYKDSGKLDLDSGEGHNAGKKFLESLEILMEEFGIECKDRSYREKFSQAYKVLYKDGSLCYLTEILNSAQEGYPYIVVNSEKYIFSPNVLRAGEKVFYSFGKLKGSIKELYNLYYFLKCVYDPKIKIIVCVRNLLPTLQ